MHLGLILEPNQQLISPFANQQSEDLIFRASRKNKTNESPLFVKQKHIAQDGAPFDLYVCPREIVSPFLVVRKARVEDCDDLVPLLKKYHVGCDVLCEINYFQF
jgi:hypothetical protein